MHICVLDLSFCYIYITLSKIDNQITVVTVRQVEHFYLIFLMCVVVFTNADSVCN